MRLSLPNTSPRVSLLTVASKRRTTHVLITVVDVLLRKNRNNILMFKRSHGNERGREKERKRSVREMPPTNGPHYFPLDWIFSYFVSMTVLCWLPLLFFFFSSPLLPSNTHTWTATHTHADTQDCASAWVANVGGAAITRTNNRGPGRSSSALHTPPHPRIPLQPGRK